VELRNGPAGFPHIYEPLENDSGCAGREPGGARGDDRRVVLRV